MKSINTKITFILIGSFLLQVILMASLFRVILAKQIINEINNHEETRQAVLQRVSAAIQKYGNKPDKMYAFISELSSKTNVDFVLKDVNGNIIYSTSLPKNEARKIREVDFVKVRGQQGYVVYAYFPAKLKSIVKTAQSSRTRFYLGLVVLGISFITSFLIYEVLAVPIKKLRRAVKNFDYGNTTVKIPYYANDELGALCRSFEDMGYRLKKSEENQIELIQAVSHDLKTPLTSILGYIGRLIDGRINDEGKRQEYYEIINRKANDLKDLLGELEEFESLGGRAKYDIKPVDCSRFFGNICEDMKSDVAHRGGRLKCINNLQGEYKISIDEAKIRRVFINIINNSIKYAGEGCSISTVCKDSGNDILFEIGDDGPGVPEDQLDKIFDRFYRVETSRSREKGGTGLGLAICKGIVEGHGGRIGARNNEGRGLCVYFTLPKKG